MKDESLLTALDKTVELKRKLYFSLFDNFAKLLQTHNPCLWQKNTCQVNRIDGTVNGCCQVCAKNTRVGCSIQSLGCKAFLCENAFNSLPENAQGQWRQLTELKGKYLRAEFREDINDKI